MAQIPIHPDLMESLGVVSRAQDKLIEAHKWARENVGNFASKLGETPEYVAANRQLGETVFDFLVPNPEDPVSMMMALMPAVTKTQALGQVGRAVFEGTGKRFTSVGRTRLKSIMDHMFGVHKPEVMGSLRGFEAGAGRHLDAYDVGRGVPKGAFENDVFTPTGLSYPESKILTHPKETLMEIEGEPSGAFRYMLGGKADWDMLPPAMQKRIQEDPEALLKDRLGTWLHETGHHLDWKIPEEAWREIFEFPRKMKLFGATEDVLPKGWAWDLKNDLTDYLARPGYKPHYMQQPGRHLYWLDQGGRQGQRAGSEVLADFGSLIGLGEEPSGLFVNTVRNPNVYMDFFNKGITKPSFKDVLR